MPLNLPIYLDAHATTPCDPRVVEAMAPCFEKVFGNASSKSHPFGWEAEALVERAREQVAALINANPREIVFTSGATESDTWAIRGVAGGYRDRLGKAEKEKEKEKEKDSEGDGRGGRPHLIASAIEHKAVLDPCRRLESEGFRLTVLPVAPDGVVKVADLERALTPDTVLVSIMHANNEIGTINPVAEIGRLCKERGVFFHCDAVQALGWLPCDVQALGIDLLSISAHKIYGPKGVGAIYLRRRDPRVRIDPIFEGGGQERGLRSGTLNVPGIVGLGKACELAAAEREDAARRVGALRDRLWARIQAGCPEATVNGTMDRRLPNNLNVSFPGLEAEALMMGMRGVAVSSGSACTSESLEPSYVLRALGLSDAAAHGSIRFGLTRFTTEEEIDYAAAEVVRVARALRGGAERNDAVL